VKFTDEVRALIVARSKGVCDICGTRPTSYQIHHRRPRGMGGSLQSMVGGAANGLLLHPNCHEGVERNRKRAYERGWLLRNDQVPSLAPVRLWSGWWLLQDDGGTVDASPKTRPE
jgi:5-methylcytosine-specific restriction protein A